MEGRNHWHFFDGQTDVLLWSGHVAKASTYLKCLL